MATGQLGDIVETLRRKICGRDGGTTDGQLLEAFVQRRDEAAFEALVRRHGPMVWRVCRRLLRHAHDAEDAFQATFLVLVRKAANITRRELVGNWLYGAAYRAALEARTATRRSRERQVSGMPEPEAKADVVSELGPILDRELSRLPDKYRMPVVLCDLEGRTRRNVARQLGLPDGTLSGRLTTARRLLAKRLARHGLNLSAAAVAVALAQTAAAANLPPSVLLGTLKTATAAGPVLASSKVLLLTERVVKSMFLSKLKTVTSVFALAALFATTVALSLARGHGETPPPASTAAQKDTKPEPKAGGKSPGARRVIEAIDWTIIDVDDAKSTISVDDHSTFVGTGNPKLTLVATPNGLAAGGLALHDLKVAGNAKITLDGKEAALKSLKPGMRALLQTDADGARITKIDATSMRPGVFRYVLKEVDAKAQTLTATLADKKLDMEKLSVAKDAQIRFLDANVGARFVDATLADLQPGMHVALELATNENGTLVVRDIIATK